MCVLHQEEPSSRSNSVQDQKQQEIALSTSAIQIETYEPAPKNSISECKVKPFNQEVNLNLDADESGYLN